MREANFKHKKGNTQGRGVRGESLRITLAIQVKGGIPMDFG